MLVGYATFSNTSALEDDSPIEAQSEIDEISDLDSNVTIGGLTFLAEDGQPLVQGVDYEEISESIKYLNPVIQRHMAFVSCPVQKEI